MSLERQLQSREETEPGYLRLHMSMEPQVKFNQSRVRPQVYREHKPRGLWYGINDSWLEACQGIWSDWDELYVHKLELRNERILVLDSENALRQFTQKFGLGMTWDPSYIRGVDWPRVAASWGGIEVTTYAWDVADKFPWLLGWDAASGCVWSEDVVLRIDQWSGPIKHRT